MTRHSGVILRFEYGFLAGSKWDFEHHFFPPVNFPNWAVQRLFDGHGSPPGMDPIPRHIVENRSIAGFWRDATFGLTELDFELFPPEGHPVPMLQVSQTDDSGTVIDAALTAAGSAIKDAHVVVVWMYPPPGAFAGAKPNAVLNQDAWHGGFSHEIGHALGMEHPFGPGGVYHDPYCVMGLGGASRMLSPDPAFDSLPLKKDPAFWLGPCLPSAANLFKTWESDLLQNKMVVPGQWGEPFEVDLVALSEAHFGDSILATVDVGHDFDRNPRRTWAQNGTYMAEYRTATGWDANVVPAIVVHSRDIRPFPVVVKYDFLHKNPFHYGENRPVYFEGSIPQPFDTVYVSPNERFAAEVLDVSADNRTAKVRFGLQNQLRYRAELSVVSRNVTGDQVLDTGTKTITPDEDSLLCQAGNYAYTQFDEAEEVTVKLHLTGFAVSSAQWFLTWGNYQSIPVSQGQTTLDTAPGYLHSSAEYVDVSLRGDVLMLRTRLAMPGTDGKLHRKLRNGVTITVTAQQPRPSGFVIRRRANLTFLFASERTDLEDRYREDVDLCYFLRTFRGIDKGTVQPPWIDPSDPLWHRKLGERLIELGRLPGGIL
jgi:hypothetical protein